VASVLTARWKNASYHSGNLAKSPLSRAAPLPEMVLVYPFPPDSTLSPPLPPEMYLWAQFTH